METFFSALLAVVFFAFGLCAMLLIIGLIVSGVLASWHIMMLMIKSILDEMKLDD